MKVKNYKLFLESNSNMWYRGYTTNTKKLEYKWFSKENH